MDADRSVARVAQVSSSPGGVPKRARPEDRIGRLGLSSDAQRHPEVHGGPERAVCLYSLERIEALQAEGHPVRPGALGENLTLRGLEWAEIVPGTRLAIGDEVELEVSSFTVPCAAIAACFADGRPWRIDQRRHPGWSRVYARVLREGRVGEGDAVAVIAPG